MNRQKVHLISTNNTDCFNKRDIFVSLIWQVIPNSCVNKYTYNACRVTLVSHNHNCMIWWFGHATWVPLPLIHANLQYNCTIISQPWDHFNRLICTWINCNFNDNISVKKVSAITTDCNHSFVNLKLNTKRRLSGQCFLSMHSVNYVWKFGHTIVFCTDADMYTFCTNINWQDTLVLLIESLSWNSMIETRKHLSRMSIAYLQG